MLRVCLISILLLEISLIAVFQWHINHLDRWLPSVLQSTISEQIGDHPILGDLKLSQIELRLPNSNHLIMPSFTIGNKAIQVGLDNTRLNFIDTDIHADSLFVEINNLEAKLNLKAFETSAATDSDSQSIADVRTMLSTYLPQLPRHGVIERFNICLSEPHAVLTQVTDNGCISGSIKWRQVAGHVQFDLTTRDGVLLLELSDSNVSLSGHYQSAPISIVMKIKSKQLHVTTNIAKPDGVIVFDSMLAEGLSASVTQPKLILGALIDTNELLEMNAVKKSLQFDADLQFKSQWKLQNEELEIHSDGLELVRTSINFNPSSNSAGKAASEQLTILLQSSLVGHFNYPGITDGAWQLSKGLNCATDLTQLEIFHGGPPKLSQLQAQCRVPHLGASATVSGFNLSLAFDNVLVNDVAANNVKASLKLDVASLTSNDGLVPPRWFKTSLEVEKLGNLLTAKSLATRALELLDLDLQFNHDLEAGEGRIAIQYKGSYPVLKPVLEQMAIDDMSFSAGEINVASEINWQLGEVQLLNSETNLQFSKFNFAVQETTIEGAELQMALSGWPLLTSTRPAALSITEVNIGVPISDLAMTFDAEVDVFEQSIEMFGKTFVAALLSGSIESTNFRFSPLTANGEMQLDVKSLSLPEILDLEKQNLTSSGFLSGSVPIQIASANLSVSNGLITADAPGGFIRYQPDASVSEMIASNQALKIVTDIMEDFTYQHLQAEIKYTEAGDLTAKTRIEGNNPDFENGRQVNLNLNLEENLKTLLESLRLGDRIAETVTEKATNEEN